MNDSEWTGPLVLGVVEVADAPPADLFRANLMLPCPTTDRNGITLERRDGENVQRHDATSLRLTIGRDTSSGWKWESYLRLEKADITVYVTDARVALACSKYNIKSGGQSFYGDPVEMVAEMGIGRVIDRAFAARERRGKMLVGQIRYQWLKEVCFAPPDRRGRSHILLDGLSKDGEHYAISLALGSEVADQVAAEIVRRYAAYLLSLEPQWAEERLERLRQLAVIDALPPDHRVGLFKDGVRYSFHEMPVCFHMLPSTAAWMPPSVALSGAEDAQTDGGASDVLALIHLARRVEMGEAEIADLAPALDLLMPTSEAEIEAIVLTVAWFADLLAQKIPREQRQTAAADVLPRVRHHAEALLAPQAREISQETINTLSRVIRVWFVSARTIDERIEFLLRCWEDESSAGQQRSIYLLALVVAAAVVSTCIDGVITDGVSTASRSA